MKNINKLIKYYVCEIFIVIIFVIISVPIWQQIDKSGIIKIANSYHTMDYLYLDIDKYVENDNFYDTVAVVNDTNTNRDYKLIAKISKKLIKDNDIINVNDKNKLLKEIKYSEDEKYFYYLIAENNVMGSKDNYNIKFIEVDIRYNEVDYLIIENHNV